ncbi:amphi-Trp domain-containing protein [Natrononativus amylolyticus]|uniref:amphi-Trp domain-containing protein n=1 Tax=Natrononativus amylolyticus TaxID=2963434 RepID=UPI0020CED0FF|nr:amphi-Trp domain-containing protein [Natrononativus amylolyticus]
MAAIDSERQLSRNEVAAYLREFADELETETIPASSDDPVAGQKMTLVAGNQSATINPPTDVGFNVRVDDDSSLMDDDTRRVTFELEWNRADVPADDELGVE